MLTPDILNALKGYMENLKHEVTFVIQTGEHEKREELVDMLQQIATTSDKLNVVEKDTQGLLRSPVTFAIQKDGVDTGITFSGVPGGHEFNSLILAILQAGGSQLKLDESIQNMVKKS